MPPVGRSERADLHKLETQLATCKLLPVAQEGHYALRLTAEFKPLTFESGAYRVHVGVRRAHIMLEHDGLDSEEKYSAVVAEEFWKAENKGKIERGFAGAAEAGGSQKPFGFAWLKTALKGNFARSDVAMRAGKKVLPLIESTPQGWSVGGQAGDPRVADEAGPAALAGCLRGAYFSGREGEQPDGPGKKGAPACVLRPRAEGTNATAIRAVLSGAAGGLVIAVERKDGDGAPRKREEADAKAEEIKRR